MAPRYHASDSGFALVIALALMAFVLLLVVSVASLARVQSETARIGLRQEAARQNATLALRVGLGRLQRWSGPDQRATASAAIYDADPSTRGAAGVEHPAWVGVWDTDPGLDWLNGRPDPASAFYDYAERRGGGGGRFLGWLVSGDFTETDDRDASFEAGDRIELFRPEDGFRPRTARAVAIGGEAGGRFAWGVADENAKARIDAYAPPEEGVDPSAARRSRFLVNQRNAWELVGGALDGFDLDSGEAARVNEPGDLAFLAGDAEGIADALEEHAGALTAHSRSLLTDVSRGGLKTDLSAVFRNRSGPGFEPPEGMEAYADNGAHRIVRYPEGPAEHPFPPEPTWERLRSYAETTVDGANASDALAARKGGPEQSAVAPVITRFRLELIPEFEENDAQGDRLWIHAAPVLVLNNPYDAPLRIPSGMRAHFLLEERADDKEGGVFILNDWVKAYRADDDNDGEFGEGSDRTELLIEAFASDGPGSSASYPWSEGGEDIPNLLDNAELTEFVSAGDIAYRGFSFALPEVVMAPGEVVAFGAANDRERYDGENALEAGAFNNNPKTVRLPNKDAAGDELRAEGNWSRADGSDAQKTARFPGVPSERISYTEQGGWHFQGDIVGQKDADRLIPLRAAVGVTSEGGEPLKPADFAVLNEGFEISNPNNNMRFEAGFEQGRNGRIRVGGDGFDDFDAMTRRTLTLDVVSSAGFQYAQNDIGTGDYAVGYRLGLPWLRVGRPVGRKTAAEPPAFPNVNYGGAGGYAPWNGLDSLNMPTANIEMDGRNAFWATGSGSGSGLAQATFSGAPRESTGVLSIGYLQHAPLGDESASRIGGGAANPRVAATDALWKTGDFEDAASGAPLPADATFMVNEALWDGFFFSGLRADVGAGDLDRWRHVPLNQRYAFAREASADRLNEGRSAASELTVEGGFNVNSARVEAWKAVLAGAHGLEYDPVSGESGDPLQRPIARTGDPVEGAGNTDAEVVNGFRELSEGELEGLAEAIVEVVKERGPFLSLAGFVNRRLAPGGGDRALFGAIEAAIRDSGLNDAVEGRLGGQFDAGDLPSGLNFPDDYRTELVEGGYAEGTAQWIQQADILQRIAPFLTARGDTFVIRTYGEAGRSPTGGSVARARLEAVVRRTYGYVDPENTVGAGAYRFDSAAERFAEGALSPVNAAFGRRYEVVATRWIGGANR